MTDLLLGIDRLLADKKLRGELKGKRVAFLGQPASVTRDVVHSLDALAACSDIKLSAAFGPQHGMRGEKQENMIESDDYQDAALGIPVFSLYGQVRRPTQQMLDSFDVLLVDMQDIGCRIYTYFATLLYVMEGCAKHGKSVWVLDRPNPAGRPVEGMTLLKGWETFVGVAPVPMRHGLTLGEVARYFQKHFQLKLDLKVVAMSGYDPNAAPGYGWPQDELAWINPSPNIPTLSSTRIFCGSVLFEGTSLSEARGTTRPLEMVGAPGLDAGKILAEMRKMQAEWLTGSHWRPCYFEPVFHKHAGKLCAGLQVHVDDHAYDHAHFRTYRQTALFLKAVRKLQPELLQWRQPPYEYENKRLPVDILNGGPEFREWVDNPSATPADLEKRCAVDEKKWRQERKEFLLYPDE